MAPKFKVGDRVKVVKVIDDYAKAPIHKYLGLYGVVAVYSPDDSGYSYDVQFQGKGNMPFSTRELEAAPKKRGKAKKKKK